ncbi:MAG: phosphatidate cytidylyltransferase, partial [Paludibacteraceae bacterium]|nr:phosphatidate cytidylyltransferase [Paludibacteraceae bacterium]
MRRLNNFTQRTLSGAAYVAVVVGSILFWRKWLFFALSAVMAILAVREYNRLTHPRCPVDILSEFSALLLCGAVEAWLILKMPPFNYFTAAYVLVLLAAILIELWQKESNPFIYWGNLLISQLMIALPFALMNMLNYMSNYLLLAVFVLIWVNDSGAYCVGVLTAKRAKGNHKMFPRV